MYNNSGFSMKSVIIQFLFVALFIFILVWLFPTKNDMASLIITDEEENGISVLLDRIYMENIIYMKDGAKGYFTDERLPQVVGDKEKLTLGEMIDLHIVLPFTDKNGDTCDLERSYVEVTKYENEYVMKVNLKCGDEENYLLVYMGCYTYCDTDICEKNESDVKNPVIYPAKEYLYEYLKRTTGYWNESDWSAWQTTPITSTSTRTVETRTEENTEVTGYETEVNYGSPIYDELKIQIGTKKVTTCVEYGYVETGGNTYSDWTYQGLRTSRSTDTNTQKWIPILFDGSISCDGCVVNSTVVYQYYTRTVIPYVEYQCTKTAETEEPIYTTTRIIVGYEKSETPIYSTSYVTYYRYKTRTYVTGSTDVKWSYKYDYSLLNSGYLYTGTKKEA